MIFYSAGTSFSGPLTREHVSWFVCLLSVSVDGSMLHTSPAPLLEYIRGKKKTLVTHSHVIPQA